MKSFIVLAICSIYGIVSADVTSDVKVPVSPLVDAHNHIKEFLEPTVKVQHVGLQTTDPSKVSKEIPSHVQHIVTQVSQHVPVVINQHVAKQRLVRSPFHRRSNSIVTEAQYHIGQNHISTEGHKKCDYKCTSYDMPVCGFNGRCYREFESQCLLSKHNCSNVSKGFWTVDDVLCENTTTTKCYQGDM